MDMGNLVKGIVLGILGFILVLMLVSAMAPSVITALNNTANSGLPLASLFSTTGIIAMLFVVGIIIAVIALALHAYKKR